MNIIPDETVGGIVTSPLYSTALDYIKNDFHQLATLNLTESIDN